MLGVPPVTPDEVARGDGEEPASAETAGDVVEALAGATFRARHGDSVSQTCREDDGMNGVVKLMGVAAGLGLT